MTHPAAVRAARELGTHMGMYLPISKLREVIHDAIEDHLREEGWLELRDEVHAFWHGPIQTRSIMKIQKALARVNRPNER